MDRISQPRLLNAVFRNVYGMEFHADSMDNRVMLQKAVFLMRERGFHAEIMNSYGISMALSQRS